MKKVKRTYSMWILKFGAVNRKVGLWFGLGWISEEQFSRYTEMLYKAFLNKMQD